MITEQLSSPDIAASFDTCARYRDDPTPAEATARLCAHLQPTPIESTPLRHALGRCLAAPLFAPTAFPPFTRAMMDGYALRSTEVEAGFCWRLRPALIAGHANHEPLPAGHAVRIATGAELPPGADTVLRQEWAQCFSNQLRALLPKLAHGKDTEQKGSVAEVGSLILPAQHPLTPTHLAHAARHGVNQLSVHRTAKIALISIGNELTPAGQPLPQGQLYEHNLILIEATLDQYRLGELTHCTAVADDRRLIDEAIHTARAQHPDLLILVGGTSVGTHDFTRRALERHTQLLFSGINTRPGRTAVAGVTQDGLVVLALPGSPKAVHALLENLLCPALRWMHGYA